MAFRSSAHPRDNAGDGEKGTEETDEGDGGLLLDPLDVSAGQAVTAGEEEILVAAQFTRENCNFAGSGEQGRAVQGGA